MAIDTTEKRRNAARDLIGYTDNLMASLYALAQKADEVQSAGLTFTDADFVGQAGLEHVNTAMISNVLSNAPALLTYLRNGFIDDVFNAVRLR